MRTKLLEDLHVACVGRGAVHGGVGKGDAPEELGDGRVLEDGDTGVLGEEEVPEAARLGFGLEILEKGRASELNLHGGGLALVLLHGGEDVLWWSGGARWRGRQW